MTTLNILLLIVTILLFICFIINLLVDKANKEHSTFLNIIIVSFLICNTAGLVYTPPSNVEYKPKTKVHITSDSTYHIDTLYYIKIKSKIK